MDDNGNPDGGSRSALATVRTVEAVVAALVILFGAIFMYRSYVLGIRWAIEGPESGFFPFYVSLILCGSGAVILVQALRGRDRKAAGAFVERGQLRQVLSVLVPAGVYILAIQLIGIYVASTVYIALFMRLLGKYSWFRSVALAVVIGVLLFFMFEVWFQVPLYKGYLDATGWTGY